MTKNKIDKEKKTVGLMIRLYCRRKEGNEVLCNNCRTLLEYACDRLDHCPFKKDKKACRNCRIHCYKPEMKEKIRQVMRYCGPRLFLYSPWSVFMHWLTVRRNKMTE